MDDQCHSHNSSAQQHVQENNDAALDTANEHTHKHLHHSAHAERGRDKMEFSKEPTYQDSNIHSHDPDGHQHVHQRNTPNGSTIPAVIPDAEKGSLDRQDSEEDPRTHALSSAYLKYRVFVHVFIWLLFTGFVDSLLRILRISILYLHGPWRQVFPMKTNIQEAGGSQDSCCMANMIR